MSRSSELLQKKGNFSFVFGTYTGRNLAESAVSYDIGDIGEVLSAVDAVVHLRRNKNAIVSSVTINLVKGAEGVDSLLALIATDVPYPMVMNDPDNGVRLGFENASATQMGIGDNTGTNDVETLTFTFKGNLKLLEL